MSSLLNRSDQPNCSILLTVRVAHRSIHSNRILTIQILDHLSRQESYRRPPKLWMLVKGNCLASVFLWLMPSLFPSLSLTRFNGIQPENWRFPMWNANRSLFLSLSDTESVLRTKKGTDCQWLAIRRLAFVTTTAIDFDQNNNRLTCVIFAILSPATYWLTYEWYSLNRSFGSILWIDSSSDP